jgi:hypothetical protein
MAGLDPAIHVFLKLDAKDVDTRTGAKRPLARRKKRPKAAGPRMTVYDFHPR